MPLAPRAREVRHTQGALPFPGSLFWVRDLAAQPRGALPKATPAPGGGVGLLSWRGRWRMAMDTRAFFLGSYLALHPNPMHTTRGAINRFSQRQQTSSQAQYQN